MTNLPFSRSRVYDSIIFQEIPRLLSLQDREPLSPTYGCFDRTYWQWKFKDFPDARFQEAVFALSWVWTHDFAENVYRGNKNIKSWVEAGLLYWAKIQDSDGSFSEAYPYEKSIVATGFSLFCVTEAIMQMGDQLDPQVKERVMIAVRQSAHWLSTRTETHAFISNHKAGIAVGLLNAFKLTGDVQCEKKAQALIQEIRENQSTEGWYSEYGGADPGYETQGLYYLSVYYSKTKDSQLLESLKKSIHFLQYFIHPDGTVGGEYGSRNTAFCFPAAFEILSKEIPLTNGLIEILVRGFERKRAPSAHTTDFFNSIPILNSVCLARGAIVGKSVAENPIWAKGDFSQSFPEAGLWVCRREDFYVVVSTKKGGVWKLFSLSDQRLLSQDCGYLIRKTAKGQRFSTQARLSSQEIQTSSGGIELKGAFYRIRHELLTPLKMIILRTFNIIGQFGLFSDLLKRFIVGRLTTSGNLLSGVAFERKIALDKA